MMSTSDLVSRADSRLATPSSALRRCSYVIEAEPEPSSEVSQLRPMIVAQRLDGARPALGVEVGIDKRIAAKLSLPRYRVRSGWSSRCHDCTVSINHCSMVGETELELGESTFVRTGSRAAEAPQLLSAERRAREGDRPLGCRRRRRT